MYRSRLNKWINSSRLLAILLVLLLTSKGFAVMPAFTEPVRNVTVIAGRNAKMSCVVENLGKFRITWSHLDTKTLLTLDKTIITKNERFNMSENQRRQWWLHINNVQPSDRGSYMCQINTSPMISRITFLQVLVPPQIDESRTSTDIDAQENEKVVLRCEADGFPKPTVSWQREDNKKIHLGNIKTKVHLSKTLVIPKVSRLHMGAYLCIASNDVKPSMSKMIDLRIHFAPVMHVPEQLIGIPRGSDVTIKCRLESYPRAMTFWMKSDEVKDDVMIITNKKYDVLNIEEGIYDTQMVLKIHNLQKEDFGLYGCHAKSAVGETSGKIRLYETEIPRHLAAAESSRVSKGDDYTSLGSGGFSRDEQSSYSDINRPEICLLLACVILSSVLHLHFR